MQIDFVEISCNEDVHICRTNFAKQMEQNLHETTSWWKTYGKRLFFKDLEVRDVGNIVVCQKSLSTHDVIAKSTKASGEVMAMQM
jgi:hypothetical protein